MMVGCMLQEGVCRVTQVVEGGFSHMTHVSNSSVCFSLSPVRCGHSAKHNTLMLGLGHRTSVVVCGLAQ